MKKELEKAGHKFGKWVVIDSHIIKGNNKCPYLLCRCECGVERYVIRTNLRGNRSTMCRSCSNKAINTTHGLREHPLYYVWGSIISRTSNKKCKNYHNYGLRGITLCDDWRRDFKSFFNWCISHGYKEKLEIDRIDNDGNYEPSNCRFVNRSRNQRNKRSNVYLTAFGETKTMADWADDKRCVVAYTTLSRRIREMKWDHEKAITKPNMKKRKIK